MSTTPSAITLNVTVLADDIDQNALDQLTRRLRSEIQEQGVDSVELARGGPTPAGTKSVEAITIGSLAVSVLPGLLPKLVDFLQSWVMRGQGRTIKIKAQVADRMIEMEYSPDKISQVEMKSLVEILTGALSARQ